MKLRGLSALVAVLLAACTVGPDYKRPDAPMPVAFKETAGWTVSHPADAFDKGAWWSVYHDPELDMLERMVAVNNQNVKGYEAQYRNAVALVAEARAGFYPTLGVTGAASRVGGGTGGFSRGSSSGNGFSGGGVYPLTEYSITGSASWTPDLWGRIRRQVESSKAGAQLNAADLANATLSAQGTLATDYFSLRYQDSLADLLRQTVAAYQRALTITENQYRAGTTPPLDYATALAQLQTAQAQLAGVGVLRQQYEHAIAVLAGIPPVDLTIPPRLLATEVPVVPPGLPSTLLQRRPDVAAAERAMQEENALIGVQVAAFYPTITLSADGGFSGTPLTPLFTAANSLWSLGVSGAETLFEGGQRTAAVAAARATYDASVATYRQTVLTALQQVEDALSDLRILEQQAAASDRAVRSSARAVQLALNTYRAGTAAFTTVITEQTQLLGNQESALSIQQSRLVNSVALIQALGGGWTTDALPKQVRTENPLLP